MAVGDGAPEMNNVFASSAEDRGTSIRTALCCNEGIDDQAQTPQSARFGEEQRKIREVSQNFGVRCVQLSDCVDVFSESFDVEDDDDDDDDVELVLFAVERDSAFAEEVRVMHDSLCVDDQSDCLGEEWDVRQDVAGVEWQAVAPLPGGYIVGRLRSCLPVWHEMGASQWIIKVLAEGYRLLLVSEPRPRVFKNHRTSVVHEKFVDNAIAELAQCGSAREVSMAEVCVVSPLGVVEGRKLRLILDLRYVNNHLATFRFKCDGLD